MRQWSPTRGVLYATSTNRRLAGRATSALIRRDFLAGLRGLTIAADASDAERPVQNLDFEHPHRAGWPGGMQARAFLPVAGNHGRRAGELQGTVRVDGRPPVGHLHIGKGLFDEAIEARPRPAGINEIVAAAGRRRAKLVFGTIARHGNYQKSRGQFSVAILILFRMATPLSATRQPHPRQICRSASNQLHDLQC